MRLIWIGARRHGLSRSLCLIHMHLDFARSVKMAAQSRPCVKSRLIVILGVHNMDTAPVCGSRNTGKVSICYIAKVFWRRYSLILDPMDLDMAFFGKGVL